MMARGRGRICGSSTRSSGRTTGSSSSLRSRPRSRPSRFIRPARPRSSASAPQARRRGPRARRRRGGAGGRGLLRMAGDRGLLHPEVPASAVRDEAADLVGRDPRRLSVLEPDLRDRPPATDRPPVRVVRVPARAADALGASGAVRGPDQDPVRAGVRDPRPITVDQSERHPPAGPRPPPRPRPGTTSNRSRPGLPAGGAGAPSPTQVFKPRWWW